MEPIRYTIRPSVWNLAPATDSNDLHAAHQVLAPYTTGGDYPMIDPRLLPPSDTMAMGYGCNFTRASTNPSLSIEQPPQPPSTANPLRRSPRVSKWSTHTPRKLVPIQPASSPSNLRPLLPIPPLVCMIKQKITLPPRRRRTGASKPRSKPLKKVSRPPPARITEPVPKAKAPVFKAKAGDRRLSEVYSDSESDEDSENDVDVSNIVRRKNGSMEWWDEEDGEWKPASYHRHNRADLIRFAAQQPGAPVWTPSMGTNYTSFSILTENWNDNPCSVVDTQDRQVMYMNRPDDWNKRGTFGPLIFNDRILLDDHHNPVRDIPWLPLTLNSEVEGWLLVGVRRCEAIELKDISARLSRKKSKKDDTEDPSWENVLTARSQRWLKGKGIPDWFPRGGEAIRPSRRRKRGTAKKNRIPGTSVFGKRGSNKKALAPDPKPSVENNQKNSMNDRPGVSVGPEASDNEIVWLSTRETSAAVDLDGHAEPDQSPIPQSYGAISVGPHSSDYEEMSLSTRETSASIGLNEYAESDQSPIPQFCGARFDLQPMPAFNIGQSEDEDEGTFSMLDDNVFRYEVTQMNPGILASTSGSFSGPEDHHGANSQLTTQYFVNQSTMAEMNWCQSAPEDTPDGYPSWQYPEPPSCMEDDEETQAKLAVSLYDTIMEDRVNGPNVFGGTGPMVELKEREFYQL